jgi:hypothetical protein
MLQVEMTCWYSIPLSEGFAYITDMNNWQDYWPGLVRIKDPGHARWSKPGDTVTLVLRLFHRERELTMKLEEYMPDMLVTYHSHQMGLPDAHHERHFRAVQGGFEYRLVVAYVPRPSFVGLVDRTLVRKAVKRALLNTHQNLDAIFRQRTNCFDREFPTKGD